MMIFIGSDHRGFELKAALMHGFPEQDWVDAGCYSTDRTDFPIYAHNVCREVVKKPDINRGILICGSGIGMCIAANRYKNIYAALCWNEAIATTARSHDNANVLVLPAGQLTTEQAFELVRIFLNTPFNGGTYQDRLCMIDEG
jgi:ribose 5-phosphate isomerase B